MFARHFHIDSIASTALLATLAVGAGFATECDAAGARFDTPPIAAAVDLPDDPSGGENRMPAPDGYRRVRVDFRLSMLMPESDTRRIEQVMLRCQPRSGMIQILDYGPRTETASHIAGTVAHKNSDEVVNSVGLSAQASFSESAAAKAGVDRSTKASESVQFETHPAVEALIASGSINRGTGVYFKMRWTNTQVLEGEKKFHLVMLVPRRWRGCLIDLDVQAHRTERSFLPLEPKDKVVAAEHFVIATYDQADAESRFHARKLAAAELKLRRIAAKHSGVSKIASLPELLHRLAHQFDPPKTGAETSAIWVSRLLADRADPFIDEHISKQPMPVRIAAIEYDRARARFTDLSKADDEPQKSERRIATWNQ